MPTHSRQVGTQAGRQCGYLSFPFLSFSFPPLHSNQMASQPASQPENKRRHPTGTRIHVYAVYAVYVMSARHAHRCDAMHIHQPSNHPSMHPSISTQRKKHTIGTHDTRTSIHSSSHPCSLPVNLFFGLSERVAHSLPQITGREHPLISSLVACRPFLPACLPACPPACLPSCPPLSRNTHTFVDVLSLAACSNLSLSLCLSPCLSGCMFSLISCCAHRPTCMNDVWQTELACGGVLCRVLCCCLVNDVHR
mmetsp:Transcript_28571/g.82404  ORF Transcript_28571/g.82404 Transcript_28571/m.82404 type:complete len:251 (-) Transcript_28571:259-1011(-)